MLKHAHVIVNPAAGHDDPVLHAVYHEFAEAGIDWDLTITHGEGDARRQAAQAVNAGVDVLVVYGGDGTVRETVPPLVESGVPLAILPGGTGNIFAVELAIPRLLRRAARLVASDHQVMKVDVGYVGDEPFLVAAATGIIAGVMETADRQVKNQLGVVAYFAAALQQIQTQEPADYAITIDGVTREGRGIAAMVANGTNLSVARVSVPRGTDVRDGLLDVMIFKGTDLQTIVTVAADAVGVDDQVLDLPRWQGKTIRLESDPVQKITVDGDIIGQTPTNITLRPEALNVIVPKPKIDR